MGRRFLGNWADSLPPNRRPPAIIGIGVLLAEYWERTDGQVQPEELDAGGVEHIADAYQKAYDELNQLAYPKRLRWGHDEDTRWEAFKRALSPDQVADAWDRFLRGTKVDLQTWHYSEEQAADTYSWLAEVAWDNDAGVRTLFAEWWDSGDARKSWHWPLRIGFLDDPNSRSLFDAFHHSERDWIRRLATAVEVERNGLSCDLLISPLDAGATANALWRARANAPVVALVGHDPFDTRKGANAAADLQRAARASTVAFIRGAVSLDVIVEVIRETSHDRQVDAAFNQA